MNIKDIAAAAGVSATTVSKVIHRKDSDISEATRNRVLQIIRKYHYKPYMTAIETETRQSHIIGVLVRRGDARQEALEALDAALRNQGYHMLVLFAEQTKTGLEELRQLLPQQPIEGLLILDATVAEQLGDIGLPVVILGAEHPSYGVGVTAGQEEAIRGMTEYLLQHGHHKIAYIWHEGQEYWRQRCQQILEQQQIHYHVSCMETMLNCDLDAWLPSDCTAVICQDMSLTIKLMNVLSAHGLNVPRDISVASLSDHPYAAILQPAITAMRQQWKQLAACLAGQIISLVEKRPIRHAAGRACMVIERESIGLPARGKKGQKLIVVGSLNMDINISLPHIPQDGENIQASAVAMMSGGKGGNQAIGASRLGADTYLIGCMGKDAASHSIYSTLQTNHVHCDGILLDPLLDTGKAYINIADDGESTIVIYHGANNQLTSQWMWDHQALFQRARYGLLSTEIPLAAIKAAMDICKQEHIPVILKPAGVTSFPLEWLSLVDYIVPSRRELNSLVPGQEAMEDKAAILRDYGARHVIVTLGKDGCFLLDARRREHYPAMDVKPVDTTGGADAFISTLAVYLSEGMDLEEAIGFATCSAGLCISCQGVQPGLPQRERLDIYRKTIEKGLKEE